MIDGMYKPDFIGANVPRFYVESEQHYLHVDDEGDFIEYKYYKSLLEQNNLLISAWNEMRKERDELDKAVKELQNEVKQLRQAAF